MRHRNPALVRKPSGPMRRAAVRYPSAGFQSAASAFCTWRLRTMAATAKGKPTNGTNPIKLETKHRRDTSTAAIRFLGADSDFAGADYIVLLCLLYHPSLPQSDRLSIPQSLPIPTPPATIMQTRLRHAADSWHGGSCRECYSRYKYGRLLSADRLTGRAM